jgi:hypothetical protein
MKVINFLTVGVIALAILYSFLNSSLTLYYTYTFLAILLLRAIANPKVSKFIKFSIGLFLLGNWLKVTLHGIFKHPYVEATGSFSDTPEQWGEFFYFSIAISIAFLISVLANIRAPRKNEANFRENMNMISSKVFAQVSIFLILAIYVLNWEFGFYRIGIARTLSLPFGLDAPASFMVFMVAPMLTAILATNSVIRHRRVTIKALLGVALVAIIAAITTYSRSTVAILMLPIVLGMYQKSRALNQESQSFFILAVVMLPTVVGMLAAVSVLRILAFRGTETVSSDDLSFYLYQSLGLFLDRWIGAEGLLVAVSTDKSVDLFMKLVIESPAAGVNSLYQHLAGSQYLTMNLENMTFLTLPGAFAILAFSGSILLTILGVIMINLLGVIVENVTVRFFPGQFAIHFLVSSSLAYHFSQMIFPRLFLPFLIQMLFFMTILSIVYRQTRRTSPIRRNALGKAT